MSKKPAIINLGPDENHPPEDSIPAGTKWLVYSYTSGDYDGTGEAYCYANGKFYERSLGHCSCYGAWNDDDRMGPASWSEVSLHDLLYMHLAGDNGNAPEFRKAMLPLIKNIKRYEKAIAAYKGSQFDAAGKWIA